MSSSFLIFIVVAVVVAAVVLLSYRSDRMGRFGTFEPSRKVEQYFKRCQLPDQYHYYWYGESSSAIFALAGLDQGYTMADDTWQRFEPEEAILQPLLENMTSDTIDSADGYLVLGPEKTPMGIFYTTLPSPAVQIDSRQQVTFHLEIPSSLIYGE